jgi:hypothetical protein
LDLFRCALVTGGLVAAATLAVQSVTSAQEQSPRRAAGWPCGARLDPTYFQGAEATGGKVFMIAPDELGDPDAALTASIGHPHTIFRFAGAMNPGVHEFRVPVDPSVESVVFFMSVQCLQTADVARPSGAPLAGGDGVTLSSFRALRAAIVKRPEAGVWTLRVAGSGMASVMVEARSDVGIEDVQFATAGSTAFTRFAAAGVENSVRITFSGRATQVTASLVDGEFRRIAPLPLTIDASGSYVSRFAPGEQGFRVLIEGKDADGVPFQRVHGPLQIPAR